jgi:hypothetical protein
MGIVRKVFAASAIVFTGFAHAQQPEQVSPYSLGFSVARAPVGLKDLSLVGRAQLSSFSAFGKLGTTSYARPDTSLMGMSSGAILPAQEPPTGLSWGGGVSWDFTPRMTATFEWISYDLRMPNGPVRSTSLGLQYKY